MENETNSHLLWCSVGGTGAETDIPPFNELDVAPINYSSAMGESVYRDSYLNERLQLWIDNLNLLYVAFTRACKNLVILGRADQRNTVSELLQDSLRVMEDIGMQHEDISEEPESDKGEAKPDIYEFGTLCPSGAPKQRTSTNRLTLPATGIPVHIESLENNIEFKQSNRSADFIQGDEDTDEQSQYIRQGQLLHNLFASIGQDSDLPQAIGQLSREGILESEEQEAQITKLAQWALNHPKVKTGTTEVGSSSTSVPFYRPTKTETCRPGVPTAS